MRPALRRPVRHRGLTLVEILVVAGIIALLVAILIPLVGRARANGRLVQCISNLRQFDVAFKGQDPARPDTRLPQASMWMGVVAQSAAGAHKLLQCPDGAAASGGAVNGGTAIFHIWSGNGVGNPNGSRLSGDNLWRETRSNPGPDGSYTSSFKAKPNGATLVIAYRAIGGQMWSATVAQHPGAPYRVDVLVTSDGRRFVRVAQGFSVQYDPTAGGVDYGFNALGGGMTDPRAGKVVVMDFNKPYFDFDGWQTAALPDDYLPAKALSRRHLKKINALLSDGSVQSLRADELPPSNEIYAIAKRGPNPGTAEPADASGSSGGGSGGGNGGGNGGGGGGGGGGGNGGGNGKPK